MKEIPLTQGKVALVDDEDFEWLSRWKWYAHWDGWRWYATRKESITKKTILMHRVIASSPVGVLTDHKNGDGLDNQRHNLRHCNNSKNQANNHKRLNTKSKYKGVELSKNGKRWSARIVTNQKHIYLGIFDNEEDAARAYDIKARELWGDFARTNFEI